MSKQHGSGCPTLRGDRHATYRCDYRCGVRCLQHHHSTSPIEHLQAVSRSTTSVYEKLLRKDMQDRIRHLHEILPKKIARSISRYQAKAGLLALAMASLPAIALAQGARSQAPPYCFDL